MLYKPEMLPIFNTHPVIAYFGMDTIVDVMRWYIQAYGATVDADILESELLHMMMHEHDRFFQMVEDYIDAKG
jgi:hypothetical protein